MEDTRYFNSLVHILDNSNIVNNISLQGETNDLNLFITHLSELGFSYVVAKSVKYEGNNYRCLDSYLLNFQKLIILKLTSDKSLNSTIEIIIDQFLPESLRKYNLKNLKLTGEYKKFLMLYLNFYTEDLNHLSRIYIIYFLLLKIYILKTE
jgi:hypothetical protein